MKNNRLDITAARSRAYKVFCWVMILILAFLFTFPLYWIITGSFKTPQEINAVNPSWFPKEFVLRNYEKLMSKRTAPLFNFEIFGLTITGPKIPGALRWLINTVFMSVASMIITCVTSAMAGYVLAKKKFYGRALVFSLIVCAMALPKQVVLVPLVRLMSNMGLYDNIWAVIFPIVGWPFGVFLLKQFAEGIPTEMVEACRIDGAGEWRTFTDVMFPMIKPGVGACAIFTFINSWNDYFMQLIMLTSTSNLTISLGIATMQGEVVIDYGLLMAGSAMASIPIIIVFLIFQKYFTKGITMGAVKG
jgi:multiple sugar transport system permease protein